MKKLLVIALLAAANIAIATQAVNIAGTYNCSVHSNTNFHSTVTYTLDKNNTDFSKGYSAYSFKGLSESGTIYQGQAIANGSNLAIYYKNLDPTKTNDYGIEIVTVTHNFDSQDRPVTILRNIGYGAPFNRNSTFQITCISKN
ncbi:MAG: hypothetical protein Q7V63_02155 [Gammaproteobacteria bacterium]|nr:hypothetical protein [Gammaproteobacteria bacterium]